MQPPTSLEPIRARIDAFLDEISGLVRQSALLAVQQALGEGTPGRRRRARSARRRATRRGPGHPRRASAGPGRRRSSEAVAQTGELVLAHVKANPGQRLEEISSALGMPSKELKLPVQKLLKAKRLKTKGLKRGTKYFPGRKRAASATRKVKKGRRGKRAKKAA